VIIDILNKQDEKILEKRLAAAADYIDTRMSYGFTLSFSIISDELFLLDKKTISRVLDEDIYLNIKKAIDMVKKGETSISLIQNGQDGTDNFKEQIFRNAAYGYCFRIAEEQLEFTEL
jgi:hypothetical protein